MGLQHGKLEQTCGAIIRGTKSIKCLLNDQAVMWKLTLKSYRQKSRNYCSQYNLNMHVLMGNRRKKMNLEMTKTLSRFFYVLLLPVHKSYKSWCQRRLSAEVCSLVHFFLMLKNGSIKNEMNKKSFFYFIFTIYVIFS